MRDSPVRIRPAWYALGVAWIITIAVLVAWLTYTPAGQLRDQLRTWQFWSLELCIALVLSLGAAVGRGVWRELGRRDLMVLSAVSAVALCLTLFVAPRTNRIYYDEQIYQSIGQNLADLRLAQMCNDGTVEYGRLQCVAGEYNKQPYAYPHLLSVVYRLFGVGSRRAFAVNAVVMALTVWVIYLAALFLFRDRLTAGFAGALVMVMPQQVIWTATAAAEPTASLACGAALAAAAYFTVARTTAALTLAGVTAAYAVQFRPESILILLVLALLLWQRTRDEWRRPRFWWVGLLFVVLIAVHVGHSFAVRHEGWGTEDARLSFAYVLANVEVNGRFYLLDERFPVLVTLLAAGGLAARRGDAARWAVLVYFALFFGIYLLFYAGSYDYGADVRYSLLTYPPLAILGGLGAAQLAQWLTARRLMASGPAGVTLALAFQLLWYLPLIRATTEEAWAARTDVRFADSLMPSLRGNSYVLTNNPNMFHVAGVNAGQLAVIVHNPSYLDYLATRYAGGVYLHWNFWCNVQVPAQQELCRKSLATKPAVLVHEVRERDQRFALYRFVDANSPRQPQ